MVDKSLVLRKISDLETYLNQIKEFSAITVDQYKGDWKSRRVIERTIQIMIETCTDISNHIISDKVFRTPTSYADTFKVLSENNIIGNELFVIMEKMVKFRNVVVHQYEEVDAEIVVVILRKHLNDFEAFKAAILKYLKVGMVNEKNWR